MCWPNTIHQTLNRRSAKMGIVFYINKTMHTYIYISKHTQDMGSHYSKQRNGMAVEDGEVLKVVNSNKNINKKTSIDLPSECSFSL